jgi:valyl-tRNA synthetase
VTRNTFEIGRNFVNKLHQVSRFIKMRLDGRAPVLDSVDENDLVIFDRWILSRMERTIQTVEKSFGDYRLSAAAKALYNFVWNDYCSWYVELIKPDQPGASIREGSLNVATYVLTNILKLLHPLMPFVTERIYLDLLEQDYSSERTLSFGPWPRTQGDHIDDALEQSLEQIQNVVTAVRAVRAELNVPPGKKSDLYIRVNGEEFGTLLENHIDYFRSLIRVKNLHAGVDVKKPPLSASTVISGAEIYVPLEGLIDIEVEKARLEKELKNLGVQLEKTSKKLANADFRANAPGDVIEREELKKEDYQERIERLNKNLEQIIGW